MMGVIETFTHCFLKIDLILLKLTNKSFWNLIDLTMTSLDRRRGLFRLLRRVRRIFDGSEGDRHVSDVDDFERFGGVGRRVVVPTVVDFDFSDENVRRSNDVGVAVNDGVRRGPVVANSALLKGRAEKESLRVVKLFLTLLNLTFFHLI